MGGVLTSINRLPILMRTVVGTCPPLGAGFTFRLQAATSCGPPQTWGHLLSAGIHWLWASTSCGHLQIRRHPLSAGIHWLWASTGRGHLRSRRHPLTAGVH